MCSTDLTETLGPKPIQEIAEGLGGWPVIVGNYWDSNNSWTWNQTVKEFSRLGFDINYIVSFFVQVDIANTTKHIITVSFFIK